MNPEEEVLALETEKWQNIIKDSLSKGSRIKDNSSRCYDPIIQVFGNNYLAKYIDPLLNDLVLFAQNGYLGKAKAKRNAGLDLMCFLSLTLFKKFSSVSTLFLNDLMPLISELDDDRIEIFFALAFVTSFSTEIDQKVSVAQSFMNLDRNPFSNEMIAEIIKSTTIILASLPPETIIETLLDDLEIYMDEILSPENPMAIILPGIDLFEVVFEAIRKYEEGVKQEEENGELSDTLTTRFTEKYIGTMDSLAGAGTSKEEIAILRKAGRNAVEFMESEEIVEDDVNVNQQTITFRGKGTLVLLEAIRKLTKGFFLTQLAINLKIRKFFGYSLMSLETAQRMRLKYKDSIAQHRMDNAKDREMSIEKERKKKEKNESE